MFSNPTIAAFKTQFFRDFPYGGPNGDMNTQVLDADITNAMNVTNISINQGLFADQNSYNVGYLLLTAHNMVLSLRASSQGLNGQWNWAQSSKSVAAVSENFEIPQRIKDNPELMMLTKTQYGGQYLQLILPQLCGQVFSIMGRTKP